MTQSTPPGWYPDGQGGQRWWDGNQWTEHTLPPPEASDRPAPPAQPEQPARPGPSDVTQVRPPDQPSGGDRPAPPEPGQPPAAMPTQVAGGGAPGQAQPAYPQQQAYPAGQQGFGQPGQPGQPAWQGQQGGGSGGRGPNAKLLALVGGGAALVILLVIIMVVVLGGGSGPKDVAEEYFEKSREQNCDVVDLVSDDTGEFAGSKEECEDDPEAFFGFSDDECDDADVELKNEEEDGDRATVDFEITADDAGCEGEGTIELVKEDGDWLVDGLS